MMPCNPRLNKISFLQKLPTVLGKDSLISTGPIQFALTLYNPQGSCHNPHYICTSAMPSNPWEVYGLNHFPRLDPLSSNRWERERGRVWGMRTFWFLRNRIKRGTLHCKMRNSKIVKWEIESREGQFIVKCHLNLPVDHHGLFFSLPTYWW